MRRLICCKGISFGILGMGVAIASLALNIRIPSANAQAVVEDTSLFTRVTVSGQDFTIHDGSLLGTNLFHSFDEFSVPFNGSATFNNASNIGNIIGRITGTSASDINGMIAANGVANLFLLNPNGIVFGPGAQLNIGGSFIGSTAENMQFSDGTVFSSSLSGDQLLLTVSTPTGLQLGASSGAIALNGAEHKLHRLDNGALFAQSPSNLSVSPGRTLALIGNGLNLQGGRISTTGGRIELGGVASGSVGMSAIGPSYNFDYTQVDQFADVTVSRSLVDAINPGGGFIQLQGQDISVLDGAEIFTQNQAPIAGLGGIIINASQQFEMAGKSPIQGIGSTVSTESLLGEGGDINISAQTIVFNGSIGVETKALLAPGGDVIINATDSILLTPSPDTPNNTTGIDTLSFGPAHAGNIVVNTHQLAVIGGSTVASLAYDTGNSGNVRVDANTIEVEGVDPNRLRPSIITSGTFSTGNAGDLAIK